MQGCYKRNAPVNIGSSNDDYGRSGAAQGSCKRNAPVNMGSSDDEYDRISISQLIKKRQRAEFCA